MLTLYDYRPSGNGYKVRLLLKWLGKPFHYVEKDITKGETRTPEFLAKNPDGRIPLLEFEDGRCLAQSNAILWYFAEGTRYLPEDRWARALVLQWMFFEQYSHEPSVAVARFILMHPEAASPERKAGLARYQEAGYRALDVMERQLKNNRWLAGSALSIADIALYAYSHVAEEGGFEMSRYPSIRAWCDRIAAEPGTVGIDWAPT